MVIKQLISQLLVILLGIVSERHVTLGISTTTRPNYNNMGSSTMMPSYTGTNLTNPVVDLSPKVPYLDLTELLDSKSSADVIEDILQNTTHVYYTTDSLITDIVDLSWVASTLQDLRPKNGNSSLCLMISFQMTNKNRTDIDWRHIEDVLYSLSKYSEEDKRLKVLRETMCHIVLDFQVRNPQYEYARSQRYLEKSGISFTKYAKKLVGNILGNNEKYAPVGVVYDADIQEPYNKTLFEQEIRHADFAIVSVRFSPVTTMPVSYEETRAHLIKILNKNQHLINEKGTYIPLSFMASWEELDVELLKLPYSYTPTSYYENVLNSSEATYLELFQNFVQLSAKAGMNKIGIVAGSVFDINGRPRATKLDRFGGNIKSYIPYLYLQEVDTSPCQLRSMLAKLSTSFKSLIVNEYTWSALARNEDKMVNPGSSGCLPTSSAKAGPLRTPDNIMLFASEGIGERWNYTKQAFSTLLSEHLHIADMNLSTVVFSGDDVEKSYKVATEYSYYSSDSDTGIKHFVTSWVEDNMTDVGCLVPLRGNVDLWEPADIVTYAERKCYLILRQSSVIVLQYEMPRPLQKSASNFSFDFSIGSMKRDLVNMLVAKEMFAQEYPEKEIMFQIVQAKVNMTNDREEMVLESESECDIVRNQMEFQFLIFIWAKLHGVKVIFLPAFDLKNPLKGSWMPPNYDGTEVRHSRWRCTTY